MSWIEVTMVRIYAMEGEGATRRLLDYLHDESGVRGVTVFRGTMGYGADHRVHAATLIDVSLALPLVVEFYELPGRATPILARLEDMVPTGHMLQWTARLNLSADQGPGPHDG